MSVGSTCAHTVMKNIRYKIETSNTKPSSIQGQTQYNEPLETLSLIGQEVLDVCAASEDPLQVHPPSLDINPHVKDGVDSVQPLLPSNGVILEHLGQEERERAGGAREARVSPMRAYC